MHSDPTLTWRQEVADKLTHTNGQSRPDSGRGFLVKVFEEIKLFPLRSEMVSAAPMVTNKRCTPHVSRRFLKRMRCFPGVMPFLRIPPHVKSLRSSYTVWEYQPVQNDRSDFTRGCIPRPRLTGLLLSPVSRRFLKRMRCFPELDPPTSPADLAGEWTQVHCFYTHSLSLTHTISLSHTRTLTHTHSLTHTHTLPHTHSLSHTLSLSEEDAVLSGPRHSNLPR